MTSIIFCSEVVERQRAEEFMPHVNRLKVSTMPLVKAGNILNA